METVRSSGHLPSKAFYQELDDRFNVTNGDLQSATYRALVNFTGSVNHPRHRWFYYREGFSPDLVQALLTEFGIPQNGYVCDPFCGAGTTLTVAHSNGQRAVGFEVNPFSAFVARVKTRNYSEETVAALSRVLGTLPHVSGSPTTAPPDNDYIQRIFEPCVLEALLLYKDFINSIPNSRVRDLLFLAWLTVLEPVARYRKAGNGLKLKRKPPVANGFLSAKEQIGRAISHYVRMMIADLKLSNHRNVEPQVIEESAVDMDRFIADGELDAAIFSPPYANCFDYTKIYFIELWMGDFVQSREEQKAIRMKSVRSHVHATWPARFDDFFLSGLHDVVLPAISSQKLWTDRIPGMVKGYFEDMNQVLCRLFAALRPGGSVAIVVSNSAYGGVVVPTDVFLAEMAQQIGFDVIEVEVERLIITSSQQYHDTEGLRKYLRESIVKLRKPQST